MADHMSQLDTVLSNDKKVITEKDASYGSSWKQRGGVGAFMMLARKWDRIENQCKAEGYDIFMAAAKHEGAEGILDDIGDLRRYLALVEAELLARCGSKPQAKPWPGQGAGAPGPRFQQHADPPHG